MHQDGFRVKDQASDDFVMDDQGQPTKRQLDLRSGFDKKFGKDTVDLSESVKCLHLTLG